MELRSPRCCLLLTNAAVPSALNPAKVSVIRLCNPGSVTAQTTYAPLWFQSDTSSPEGLQGAIAYTSMSPCVPPPQHCLRQACDREQTGWLSYPLLTITSVSSQGDLVFVAGYHECELQEVAYHHWSSSSQEIPVGRTQWGLIMFSTYGIQIITRKVCL